jgi:uncharacterized protein (TIGR02145 family)
MGAENAFTKNLMAVFVCWLSGNRNTDGSFNNLGSNANFWSSSESSSANAWRRNLNSSETGVNRNANNKGNGFSVRCFGDLNRSSADRLKLADDSFNNATNLSI